MKQLRSRRIRLTVSQTQKWQTGVLGWWYWGRCTGADVLEQGSGTGFWSRVLGQVYWNRVYWSRVLEQGTGTGYWSGVLVLTGLWLSLLSQDVEVPLHLLRYVCLFCGKHGLSLMKECFEAGAPESLPFPIAHAFITIVSNVSPPRRLAPQEGFRLLKSVGAERWSSCPADPDLVAHSCGHAAHHPLPHIRDTVSFPSPSPASSWSRVAFAVSLPHMPKCSAHQGSSCRGNSCLAPWRCTSPRLTFSEERGRHQPRSCDAALSNGAL